MPSIELTGKSCVIIGNGEFLEKNIILEAAQGKTMIALDGAANRLTALGIIPDIILGDFDSIHPEPFKIKTIFQDMTMQDQPYLNPQKIWIVPAKDQKFTDLTKAILFCDQHDVADLTLVCVTGGRLDHHEGAVRSLRSHYQKNRPMILHTEQQSLRYAKDEHVVLSGKVGDKVGILAYPHGWVTSHGLAYEADHYELNFGFSENICNELKTSEARVEIEGEALLVMPPQLHAQRKELILK